MLAEGGQDLQERIKKGLSIKQQEWLSDLFGYLFEEDFPRSLEATFTTYQKNQIISTFNGDIGQAACQSYASAFWFVKHARILIEAVISANKQEDKCVIDGAEQIGPTIVSALSNEIGLPRGKRTELLAHLLIDVGLARVDNQEKWTEPDQSQLNAFAEKVSHSFSGSGFELYVLPWAFRVEYHRNDLSIEERVESLRGILNPEKGGHSLGELEVRGLKIRSNELNRWAYFLMLAGSWKPATAMAILAAEKERSSATLDTLGLAYYFENDIERSIRILDESIKLVNVNTDPQEWALIMYHKLIVCLNSERLNLARDIYHQMTTKAPDMHWTRYVKRFEVLFAKNEALRASKPRFSIFGIRLDFKRRKNKSVSYTRSKTQFIYDVALSFAGEDREQAGQIARRVSNAGVRVFYDDFEKAELWGKNLYDHLTDLYRNRARYWVWLISKDYRKKRWTDIERQAAQAAAFTGATEDILPIRMDQTEIKGILPATGYSDLQSDNIDLIITAILEKIHKSKK